METRFIYRANAVAAGGRLVRPAPVTIAPQASLALSVVGGSGSADSFDFRVGSLVSYQRASTSVAGGPLPNGAGWGTTSEAIVEGLSLVGGRVTLDRMVARLTSFHRTENGRPEEPRIRLDGTRLEGLRVDGELIRFNEHAPLLSSLATFSSVREAFARPGDFRDLALKHFFWSGEAPADAPEHLRALARSCAQHARNSSAPVLRGLLHCSIFSGIVLPRGSRLQAWGSWLGVPGVGRLQFGELLVGAESRRLTMLRLELDTAYAPPAPASVRPPKPARASRSRAAKEGDDKPGDDRPEGGEPGDGEPGDGDSGEIGFGGVETNGTPHP